jgi:hypothetical protein
MFSLDTPKSIPLVSSRVKVTLRPTISQSVSLGIEAHLGLMSFLTCPVPNLTVSLFFLFCKERYACVPCCPSVYMSDLCLSL